MEMTMPGLSQKEVLELMSKKEDVEKERVAREKFDKKIQEVALEMQLEIEKCKLDSLPDFVHQSGKKLYKNELNKEGIDAAQDVNDDKKQFFKDIYKVKCKDESEFYIMHRTGGSGRMVSDHWTKESIEAAAKMAAKMGGQYSMIPNGEPGAFPAHLRAFAEQAFARQGLDFPDPTSPTAEMIEASRQEYAQKENKSGQPTPPTMTPIHDTAHFEFKYPIPDHDDHDDLEDEDMVPKPRF